jgi:hypothetical protein
MTQLLHHTVASIKQATTSAESLTRVSRDIATMINPKTKRRRAPNGRNGEHAMSSGPIVAEATREPPRPDAG